MSVLVPDGWVPAPSGKLVSNMNQHNIIVTPTFEGLEEFLERALQEVREPTSTACPTIVFLKLYFLKKARKLYPGISFMVMKGQIKRTSRPWSVTSLSTRVQLDDGRHYRHPTNQQCTVPLTNHGPAVQLERSTAGSPSSPMQLAASGWLEQCLMVASLAQRLGLRLAQSEAVSRFLTRSLQRGYPLLKATCLSCTMRLARVAPPSPALYALVPAASALAMQPRCAPPSGRRPSQGFKTEAANAAQLMEASAMGLLANLLDSEERRAQALAGSPGLLEAAAGVVRRGKAAGFFSTEAWENALLLLGTFVQVGSLLLLLVRCFAAGAAVASAAAATAFVAAWGYALHRTDGWCPD
jgi:hypothetical protein